MKTHWLKNPNKNYLGNWDIPESGELILTIKSAAWETVIDPVTNKTQQKRVVHFVENYKPLICNQINAKNIVAATGRNFIEDSLGLKIKLHSAKYFDKKAKSEIDVVRVKDEPVKIIPKTKPKLTPNSDKWGAGIKFLVEGGLITNLKKAYSISEEHEEQIVLESMKTLEESQQDE